MLQAAAEVEADILPEAPAAEALTEVIIAINEGETASASLKHFSASASVGSALTRYAYFICAQLKQL